MNNKTAKTQTIISYDNISQIQMYEFKTIPPL